MAAARPAQGEVRRMRPACRVLAFRCLHPMPTVLDHRHLTGPLPSSAQGLPSRPDFQALGPSRESPIAQPDQDPPAARSYSP